jgi:hypothetical protein
MLFVLLSSTKRPYWRPKRPSMSRVATGAASRASAGCSFASSRTCSCRTPARPPSRRWLGVSRPGAGRSGEGGGDVDRVGGVVRAQASRLFRRQRSRLQVFQRTGVRIWHMVGKPYRALGWSRPRSSPPRWRTTAICVRREKAAVSSGCKPHPATASRKQPEQSWR